MGGGLFFRWRGSFLSGGCAPWGAISFDGAGEGFEKNHRMGGVPPTMGNPVKYRKRLESFRLSIKKAKDDLKHGNGLAVFWFKSQYGEFNV